MNLFLLSNKKLITIIETLHRRIFRQEMSDTMRVFIKNLSWSFLGGLTAAVILSIINVLAGRWLGPLEFGKYNFLLSISSILVFLFLAGNNSGSVRYLSDPLYQGKKGEILSASFFIFISQVFFLSLIYIVFKNYIYIFLNLPKQTLNLIFFLGFSFALKELFDSYLRAFGLFKRQSLSKILDACLVFSIFVITYFFKHEDFNYISYVISQLSGSLLFILLFLFIFLKRVGGLYLSKIKLLLNYNKFILLSAAGGFLISTDKIFIGKLINTESLGIYSAYYTSSQLILSTLAAIFMNIFWPTAIENKHQIRVILSKLDTLFFKYFPILFILNCINILFFIFLFGKNYPIQFSLIILFAATSLLNIFFSVLVSLLNIEKVYVAATVSLSVYIIMILPLIILRNIKIYLIFQILIYFIGIFYARKKLSIFKNKLESV